MRNPLAIVAAAMRKPTVQSAVEGRLSFPAPHSLPGYKTPERMTAYDYATPQAHWPLVWLLDIGGYDAVTHRSSGQASFSLSGAHQGAAQTRLQCQVPLHEGRLFDKEGTYVIVAIPAEDEEQVRAIMSLAGR
jgi:hypothetical protein